MKYTVIRLVKHDGFPRELEKLLNSQTDSRLVSIQKAPVFFDGQHEPKEEWVAIFEEP